MARAPTGVLEVEGPIPIWNSENIFQLFLQALSNHHHYSFTFVRIYQHSKTKAMQDGFKF